MDTQKQSSSRTSFPTSWTLSQNGGPIPQATHVFAPSNGFPSGWSLSTIPESVSDSTDTKSTVRDDFPIALSDPIEQEAFSIPNYSTFDRAWTLPLGASVGQSVPSHGTYTGPYGSIPSAVGVVNRDNATLGGIEGVSPEDIMGTVPHHLVPSISSSSNLDLSNQSSRKGMIVAPSNFRPGEYYNTHTSAESNQGPAGNYSHSSPGSPISAGSALTSSSYGRGVISRHARFKPGFSRTDAGSGASASEISPDLPISGSYHHHRPAGFVSQYHTSPHSLIGNSSVSSQFFHPPHPAGFSPDNISPPTSIERQNLGIQPNPELVLDDIARTNLPSTGLPKPSSDVPFPPIEIPEQGATLSANVNSWLYANAEQLYRVPDAPRTSTPPWRSDFPDKIF